MICRLLKIILLAMGLMVLATTACAQGFRVLPMRMEFAARPGETVQDELVITNVTNNTSTMIVEPVLLGQSAGGGWQIIGEQDNPDMAPGQIRSCIDWISVSAREFELGPQSAESVTVTVKVARGARGFYIGGLLAYCKPEGGGNIAVVVRFLIPVQVTVAGSGARERIGVSDVTMEYLKGSDQAPGTTRIHAQFSNEGETYGRVSGDVAVLYQMSGTWRQIARTPIPERGIIPGAAIALTSDLQRRLPSGKYKLEARVQVSGRRKPTFTREIDFQGDPTVTTVAADVPLELPPVITVEAIAGSTRSVVVPLENPVGEKVQITCTVAPPPKLPGLIRGEVKGETFDCSKWTSVSPEGFTLYGGARRNLRVVARVPGTGEVQANCYANLKVAAAYPDGQSAGQTEALIWIKNPQVETEPLARVSNVVIAQDQPDNYAVSAMLTNLGDIHFRASGRAAVTSGAGTAVASTTLESSEDIILPMGTPQFSGIIDFTEVKAGEYRLFVTVDYADQHTKTSLPIKVEESEEGKVVTVLESAAATDEATTQPAEENNEQANTPAASE